MRGKLQKLGLVVGGVCMGVMISLNFPAVAQFAGPGPLPVEELRAFTEVFARIKSSYVEPVEDKKLINSAITGMVAGLDPHSGYLDQDEFREMQVGTQGEFGGLGIEIGMEDGFVKVVSPIDDSPASRAGIKAGDLIVRIDEAFVKGMTLNDAVKLMRGKPSTQVTLTITRKSEPKPIVIKLTRAVIKVQSVKSQMLEPGYAYIRVTQFQERTGETLAGAIQTLFKQNQGPMRGIVLDLRNDPGGLLSGAVAVSAAFLPKDALVVYTDGRTDDSKMRLTASPEHYLRRGADDYLSRLPPEVKNVPMVILVNNGSASASEIVAGALQDYKRAVVMGATTFGKASVQSIMPLGNGTGLKLTTARYYTPNGRSIQARGIVPDIALDDGSGGDAGLRLREADLNKRLSNDSAQDKAPAVAGGNSYNFIPAPRPKDVDEKDLRPEPGEVVAKRDYELSQAMSFLKSRGAVARTN